jgi:hypothetical protein
MKYFLITILCFIGAINISQAQEKRLVQFSGVIYNVDTNAVVPYVSITNKTNNKVISANYQGYFSFVAQERDTIVFSAIGYKREAIVIPEALPDKKYTVIVKMRMESISLPAVRVYPWASLDEFNREFMTMKVADDDLEIAKKNVTRESLLAMARALPMDGKENQTLNFQNNHIELSNSHMNQRGANPLLDPLKWGAFIQQILRGDRSRSSPD